LHGRKPARSAAAQDVPAIAEYVPGYEVVSSQALFVPAKTPREIVRKISADTNTVLADPAIRDKLAEKPATWLGVFAPGAGKAAQVGNRPMERTHQVSRHHTRLIISAQMPMFLLRRVRSRLALSVGFGMSAIRSASGANRKTIAHFETYRFWTPSGHILD
jgi:hypothetical protein